MNSKELRRRAITIASPRWATYAVAGAASSLAVATAEAEIHYSGKVNFHLTGTGAGNFPLDNGASLVFDHIDEGGGKGRAHLNIINPGGPPSFVNFAADGGRESSVSGFYLFRVPAQKQVSQLPMQRSCRTTSTSSNLRCYGATIGLGSLTGCHWKRPGNGFIAFVFNAGAGNEYGWARIKTTGALMYNIILVDYAWADPGDSIRTGQKRGQETGQAAVSKFGSLGLLATGAPGLKAWRQHKQTASLH
jgi:hypothetical protein